MDAPQIGVLPVILCVSVVKEATAMLRAAVTTAPGCLPVFGHLPALLMRRETFLQAVRDHGEIVKIRLGRKPFYVLNSPAVVHRALVTEANSLDKGLIFDRARPFFGNGIVTSSGQFHLRQRRIMQPAFHRERIEEYAVTISKTIDRLVGSWREGDVLHMDKEMRKLASSAVTDSLFAGTRMQEAAQKMEEYLPLVINGAFLYTLLPAWCTRLPGVSRLRYFAAAARLRSLIDGTIDAARRSGSEGNDLLSLLVAARVDAEGNGMTDQEIRDETMSILVAGIETTGTSLSWACHVLTRRPDIADHIRAEAASAAWQPGQPAKTTDFPYTERFIMEVLRLHQPNWIMMRRTREAVDLGVATIDSGCELIYSAATLHRDPELYPDPLTFDPDRWIGWTEERQRCTFIPFGAGKRKCIGDTFAWTEMLLAILTITARWTLHADARHQVRRVATSQIHPNSLPMRVVRLDRHSAAEAAAEKSR